MILLYIRTHCIMVNGDVVVTKWVRPDGTRSLERPLLTMRERRERRALTNIIGVYRVVTMINGKLVYDSRADDATNIVNEMLARKAFRV